MEPGDHATQGPGVRYALEQYRDDRVKENVRRLLHERTAAGAAYVSPSSTTEGENPNRRAVLRETTMRSAFEYVNYNMPETVPQEVVARRQIAREMADPGIYSEGPRESDIVHQPPRHATLAPPAARMRSGRDVLLSRDHEAAADNAHVAPLPRPYVPRGIIDSHGEPYQHHRSRVDRMALTRQNTGEVNTLRQASRNLQVLLGTAGPGKSSDGMGLSQVEAAIGDVQKSVTDGKSLKDRNVIEVIVRTLHSLHANWTPDESILRGAKLGKWVNTLKTHPNPEIAELATNIDKDWRDYIRIEQGNQAVLTANQRGAEDPFVEQGSDLFGQTISCKVLDNAISQKRQAALDYNRDASEAIRQRVKLEKIQAAHEREVQNEENLQEFQARAAAAAATLSSITSQSTSGTSQVNPGTFLGRGKALETVLGAVSFLSDFNATITDPDLTCCEGDGHVDDGAGGEMPTGNQHFNILEVNPSPERPKIEVMQEDMAVQSVESQIDKVCHECPDYPGTYHHVCVPANPTCVNQLATSRQDAVEPNETSSDCRSSQSPLPPRGASPPLSRVGQVAMNELLRTAGDLGVRLTNDINQALTGPRLGDLISPPRSNSRGHSQSSESAQPIHNPPHVPSGMHDPFTTLSEHKRNFAIKSRGGIQNGLTSASSTAGRRPGTHQALSTTVSRSASPGRTSSPPQGRRTTKLEYNARTYGDLLQELIARGRPPVPGSSKNSMVILIMGDDAARLAINRDRANGANINEKGESLSQIADFHASNSSRSSRSSKRSSGRARSKRASPTTEAAEPVAKRLRTRSGLSPKAVLV